MKAIKIIALIFVSVIVLVGGCTALVGGAVTEASKQIAVESALAPVEAPVVTEAPAPAPAKPAVSASKSNALEKAQNYLDFSAFSRSGLIKQLKFEGYSTADATYGAANVGANWKEQAAKSAKNYLELTAFSRSGLIKQLKFEGYSATEATYGATQAGL